MKIAIASGKGGTGKTTISTNLAAYLSESSRIVLADLDVEEPNSGLFIKGELIYQEDKYKMVPEWQKETCELCGNCQTVCNFNAVLKMGNTIMVFPELCHGCYACSELCTTNSLPMKPGKMGELRVYRKGDLDFIESRLIIGEEQAVPLIKQTKDYIDNKYETGVISIFDSPPGTSCPVIESIRGVDIVLLITEPTPFGLHDLKLAAGTVRKLNKPFAVIVNRSGIGNNDLYKYCIKERINIIAQIPNDRKIAELYSKGSLLYNDIPSVKKAIGKIINYVKAFKRNNL